jgi:hypothetical protein
MTPDEFADKMQEIDTDRDIESGHVKADELMCSLLKELGYDKGVEIFNKMVKWYA